MLYKDCIKIKKIIKKHKKLVDILKRIVIIITNINNPYEVIKEINRNTIKYQSK